MLDRVEGLRAEDERDLGVCCELIGGYFVSEISFIRKVRSLMITERRGEWE